MSEWMIFVSHGSLRRAIGQYLSHYHSERNHQGLGNRLLIPSCAMGSLASQSNGANDLAEC